MLLKINYETCLQHYHTVLGEFGLEVVLRIVVAEHGFQGFKELISWTRQLMLEKTQPKNQCRLTVLQQVINLQFKICIQIESKIYHVCFFVRYLFDLLVDMADVKPMLLDRQKLFDEVESIDLEI